MGGKGGGGICEHANVLIRIFYISAVHSLFVESAHMFFSLKKKKFQEAF